MNADFTAPLTTLFRETFEGRAEGQDGTWFVEGKEGIFDALDTLTAAQASFRPSDACSSIAAHMGHLRYYLSLGNADIRGEEVKPDWESSWCLQEVTEEEWRAIGEGVRAEYSDILAYLESKPVWPDKGWVTGALAQLAHSAYHLGAIRQLMKVLPR